eukprot:12885207-Prorocentrum_lima.AAC.1
MKTPARYAFVRDKHLKDINGDAWKTYCRLMTQVIRHDLQSEVPTPILALISDNTQPPMVTLQISAQEFLNILTKVANTLRMHRILTAAVMTGIDASARTCFDPEPTRFK